MNLTSNSPLRQRHSSEAIRLDKHFREWIQRQPSCVSGQFSEWVNGEGRSIACHIRRAGDAGTGYKPLFSCVPLTDAEHRLQHQKGELALDRPKEWWDGQAERYLERWMWSVDLPEEARTTILGNIGH